ncbi:hypothetical protein CAMRE0001_2683 [Campylobacter rectus RM3267]|uniref:Uncharacterized protein n=1 Tax=Campylobacter rectus RM3267 TaxID=553218 RepID=B9D3Y9_CAMRE|nr:hypothetical protein CAMRE0001_2683 [Campylobacter rectus RM3267]
MRICHALDLLFYKNKSKNQPNLYIIMSNINKKDKIWL